jgi:transposase
VLDSGVMGDSVSQQTATKTKPEEWAERIVTQQRSGVSVKQFCKEQGLTEYSFYAWRKRLRENQPVRFALVERPRQQPAAPTAAVVELVLTTGERLLIGAGIDGPTLRAVLDALRA